MKNTPQVQDDLLSMEQAITRLNTTRPTFYRWLRSGKIKGLKMGRQWRFYANDIERFLTGEPPQIDLPADSELLKQQLLALLPEKQVENLPEGAEGLVELMIQVAVNHGLSDLHLEPLYIPNEPLLQGVLRGRSPAGLKPLLNFDRRLMPHLINAWKQKSELPLTPTAHEGQFSYKEPNQSTHYEFKTAFVPSQLGEMMTAKIMNMTVQEQITLDKLKLNPEVHSKITQALKQTWGLIIANGPSGCGKTTTLYAALNQISSPQNKTITIEIASELRLPWVQSLSLKNLPQADHSELIRAAMLHDPDVLMLGELPNQETLMTAMQIALQGHLVLTSLHSDDSVKALYRLLEVSQNPYTVTESLRLIMSQRLVRCLCPDCKLPDTTQTNAEKLLFLMQAAGLKSKPFKIFQAVGCQNCQLMGYRGRRLISEALVVDDEIRQAIMQGLSEKALRDILQHRNDLSLIQDGLERIRAGETTPAELIRVLGLS